MEKSKEARKLDKVASTVEPAGVHAATLTSTEPYLCVKQTRGEVVRLLMIGGALSGCMKIKKTNPT